MTDRKKRKASMKSVTEAKRSRDRERDKYHYSREGVLWIPRNLLPSLRTPPPFRNGHAHHNTKKNNNDVRRNLIFCHPFRPPCARWQARARQVRQVRSPGFCFRHTSFLFLTFYFFIVFGEERKEKNNVRQSVLHTESADVMPDSTDIGQTSRAVPSATTRKTFQRTFQRTSRRRSNRRPGARTRSSNTFFHHAQIRGEE